MSFRKLSVVQDHGTFRTNDAMHIELLSGGFAVWLASPEATFLRGKIVWANFDAEELLERAEEIKSTRLLTWLVDGIPA